MEDNGTYMTTDKNLQQIRSLVCDSWNPNSLCQCKSDILNVSSECSLK